MAQAPLQQFYIPEEQSVYLLSHHDARKLKDWVALCQAQLAQLGYQDIELIGKGAYGFVFAGSASSLGATDHYVFKFSRITLPTHLQERLEEEAFMLEQVSHPRIPRLITYQRSRGQSILVMERAPGWNLEQISLKEGRLSPRLIMRIAAQLADILAALRCEAGPQARPVVHGDIKPSNLVFDPAEESIALIDWGSSVFAQLDAQLQFVGANVMELMSDNLQQTNARLGDVYFIGEDQLNGALSSPRFDEQGVAGTLYALASAQSCRFGHRAIPANSLGLPMEFARTLDGMLDPDPHIRRQAGDYFLQAMPRMARVVMIDLPGRAQSPLVPVWGRPAEYEIDTVVYSSRKAFLREANAPETLNDVNDVQLDRYYKQFMQGMGETEKAFLASVSRLGKYPVVGGLAVRWEREGVYIDSSLNLHNPELKPAFIEAVNNMVHLARAIHRQGVFKSCLFNARQTLHLEREAATEPFYCEPGMAISYEMSAVPELEDQTRQHSYFEDGPDPEELLVLPASIMRVLQQLNEIHHTGMIIFEALPRHLKIHSYYRLLDPVRENEFRKLLARMLASVSQIEGLGVSGFMKMPYKDTRYFTHLESQPERYYPRNPREYISN
ncbi:MULTISPECIES: protein kinase domain-containing protein [unclassified Halomonas]|uniref:protein kinase domain-containing protein n=1 Tax=unclassified Halomonas TaxID=2609666 RepID=UPI0006D94235|nr:MULTISPECIES: protein kinase [unclassified Halomonas]KPQ27799.1 MAG: serine / threonine protein kinase [Halomonas sp. HL-93]SBR48658.1 serine/threonine protein kinase [Halomonas sp. HL-93]SNY96173.1 serine/threonine protein kinase [Halomonas sp. hl-4]